MNTNRLNVVCIQLCTSDDVNDNIAAASALIRRGKELGGDLIATPEMTSLLDRRPGALLAKSTIEDMDKALASFRALASELSVWLLLGSLPIRVEDRKCANRCFLISPQGEITARYDKIHMFDVDLGEGQSYQESNNYQPGDEAVIVDIPKARLGLTICYDLRFPHLYHVLAKTGAEILSVPSAFTRVTGEAHWHTLLRARAIETGSFVVAPAQGGSHADGRETFGHSLIIDPWGNILAEGGIEPGLIQANIDLSQVYEARRRIPALQHDRIFKLSCIERSP